QSRCRREVAEWGRGAARMAAARPPGVTLAGELSVGSGRARERQLVNAEDAAGVGLVAGFVPRGLSAPTPGEAGGGGGGVEAPPRPCPRRGGGGAPPPPPPPPP